MASKPLRTIDTFAFLQPPLWLLQLVFLGSFAVYMTTLNPALFRNDSPETITACVTLGISHPPSYPLHTLLGSLFSVIPVGNPAMNLNFFSALLGALGVCLFALNLWTLLSPVLQYEENIKTNRFTLAATCLVGSLCFAFSKNYWSASLAAKGSIYILQILLELGFLLLLQNWMRIEERQNKFSTGKLLYLSIFVFSLGLINHWPTQMLLVPAIGLMAFAYLYAGKIKTIKILSFKHIVVGLTVLVISTSLYLYLPLRSHLYPRLNFGAPFTFQRFIDSLLRIDYSKVETLASSIPTALSTIQGKSFYISNHILGEFNPLFPFLTAVGVFSLLRRGRKYDLLFQLLILFTVLTTNLLYLQVAPIEYWHLDDHLLTINWAVALLASCGLYSLATFYFEHISPWHGRVLFTVIGLALLCLMPIFTLFQNLPMNDQKKEFLFHGYGTTILKSMDKNALYFAESDYDYFSLLYLTEVEHKRNDVGLFLVPFLSKNYQVALLQRDPHLKSLVPLSVLSDPVNFQNSFFHWLGTPSIGFPVYCAFPNGPFVKMFLQHNASLFFRPEGLVIRLNPPRDLLSTGTQINLLNDFWVDYLIPSSRSTNPINGLFLELCAHPYLNMAHYLMLKKDMTHWNWLYDRALSLISEQPWLAGEWAKRAEGDVLLGDKKEAVRAYEISAFQYLAAGMNKKADTSLQKALTLDPKNLDARQMLTTLQTPGK